MHETHSFGYWLRRRRKALDLTQHELAARVGCSVVTVRRIEADERRPSKQMAECLAEELAVALEERPAFLKAARAELAAEQLVVAAQPVAQIDHPTLPRRRGNLPTPLTPLIGRAHEVATLCTLLECETVRLLTLIGPPGIGKTRLSLQVATDLRDAFPDGVHFVPLAPISDPGLVMPTIAQTLGLTEGGDQLLIDRLKRYLADKQLLLVLDNFEQIVVASPFVSELLVAAPQLTVLATSRVPLHLYGEHEYAVPPLALPDLQHLPSLETLLEIEAVRLFVQRAQAVQFDFALTPENVPAVAEICIRLDGLPLAIELTATRIKLFTAPALLRRLSRSLDLLSGGAQDLAPRHRTLRNAIAWSYDLLESGEQTLFARLAIFAGGWTLAAAEVVCGKDLGLDMLDGLHSLLDKSLVQQAEGMDGESRFMMLETIREYALEQLEQRGEAEATQRRHAAYYLQLAETAEMALGGPEQGVWLGQLEWELDNLRAALQWALERGATELGLRLGAALLDFWTNRANMSEGYRWLEAMLAQSDQAQGAPLGSGVSLAARAKALYAIGNLAMSLRHETMRASLEESLALYRELEDKRGIAATLRFLGNLAWSLGDRVGVNMLYEEGLALSREMGDPSLTARLLRNFGWLAHADGDYVVARPRLEEALALFREGGDKSGTASTLITLGDIARDQGDYASASVLFQEGLVLGQEVGDKAMIAWSLNGWGQAALMQGDDAAALERLQESLALFREAGNKLGMACALHNLGYVAQHQGDVERMAVCFVENLQLYRELGDKGGIAACLAGLAGVAGMQGQGFSGHGAVDRAGRAARLFGAAEVLNESIHGQPFPAHRIEIEQNIANARAQLDEATFAAAWAEGRAMSLAQAIAYALADDAEHRVVGEP